MRSNRLLPEAWRVKVVERIRPSTRDEREEWISSVGYNLFNLRSDQVFIDLLTDSGTGAMSDCQWSALMRGDETYAGSASFYRLQDIIQELFGFEFMLPVHQGRAAENALFSALVKDGNVIPGNSHFDTTRAHIEYRKAVAVDCPIAEAFQVDCYHPFKGNLDLEKLEAVLEANIGNVPFIVVTITCNKSGGQPVSLENIREVSALAKKYGVPVVMDSARFAENAWFIKQREAGYKDCSIKDIVREVYEYADGMVMSGKKDALVNIGGFLATKHKSWYDDAANYVILHEGFKTYGGLAGRDMDAMAVGLDEVTDIDYLNCRIGQVHRLGQNLLEAGVPAQQPIGGHAVVVDASAFLPRVPKEEFVAQTLAVELYLEAGVRGVEIGTLLMDRDPNTGENRFASAEFLRLAIPRRVYSNDQLALVSNALIDLYSRRFMIRRGFNIVEEAKTLRHFTLRLERCTEAAKKEVKKETSNELYLYRSR